MPIYNAEPYLAECLACLTHQTYAALEIILIVDGATDGSMQIAEAFRDGDERIRLFATPNRGQAAARNLGLQKAQGEYVMMVDADDTIRYDYIERMIQDAEGVDVVQGGYTRTDEMGQALGEYLPKGFHQFTSPCMRLYRRGFLEAKGITFPEGMIYEDVVFSLRLWGARPRYRIVDNTDYFYRTNPHSTTSRPHPDARRRLYHTLWHTQAPGWMRIYTMMRLWSHFILRR